MVAVRLSPSPPMKSASAMTRAAVIGAGVMGEGIAECFAEAGLEVVVTDVEEEALERCVAQIAANVEASARYGVVQESAETICGRITTIAAEGVVDEIRNCDVVIEAAPEILQLKRELFAGLDSAPIDTLLATNTSSMTVS